MSELIVVVVVLLFAGTFAYAGLSAAPWLPTGKKSVERGLSLVTITPGMKVYDLGCGDGRLLFAAASLGAEAHGYEIALIPYLVAQLRRLFHPARDRVKIFYKDFWHANLSDADIVYIFLMPKAHDKLRFVFEKTLRPGAQVVASTWPIDGWQPHEVSRAHLAPALYRYQR